LMFFLLFLLLSWKHFFLSHLSVRFSFFLSPFFYIYFCLSLFHLSELFVFIANILSFIISFFFLSFIILPSCTHTHTHTYVHNT
jgi:hypothetical protein